MIIAIVARKKHFYDFFCVEPGDEINMYNYYTYLEKKMCSRYCILRLGKIESRLVYGKWG